VLHFFTGTHPDYHRPSDDWDKLNVDGIRRVADIVEAIVLKTAATEARPDYIEVKGTAQPGRQGNRPYVGTIPDFGSEEPGYSISGAASGSPADKGGLKAGDRIVKFGPHKVTGLDDFDLALRKFQAGETVDVVVVRNKQEVTLKITLDPPK
jgi:S1-C subfamily serine protease